MPKIHRMKEERGRERGERGEKWEKGEDWNQKSLSIQTDGEEATWDLFVNNTWYRHGASPIFLSEGKQTNDSLTKRWKRRRRCMSECINQKWQKTTFNVTKEWRQGQKKENEEEDCAYIFPFFKIIISKSCGSEGRGVGRMSLNQKFTWGGGGGGNTQWQKDKKKKRQPYQNPKYQKPKIRREKLYSKDV